MNDPHSIANSFLVVSPRGSRAIRQCYGPVEAYDLREMVGGSPHKLIDRVTDAGPVQMIVSETGREDGLTFNVTAVTEYAKIIASLSDKTAAAMAAIPAIYGNAIILRGSACIAEV